VKTVLVSVVTPCLNPGSRIARCLDSVASQTYGSVEHIVMDGGSTDGTLDLLTKRDAHFVSEHDRGQTHAIN
jgi:glycosyltransferase involved in cell wall biosynthesis